MTSGPFYLLKSRLCFRRTPVLRQSGGTLNNFNLTKPRGTAQIDKCLFRRYPPIGKVIPEFVSFKEFAHALIELD